MNFQSKIPKDKLFNFEILQAKYEPNNVGAPDPGTYPDPKDDPNINPQIPLELLYETYPDPDSIDPSKKCRSYSKL